MRIVMEFEIDQNLHDSVKAVLDPLGISLENAIVQFLKACVACGGFPFHVTQEQLEEMKNNPQVWLVSEYLEEQ